MALTSNIAMDNFNSQYQYYIQCILQCGLIIEEDMECIMHHFPAEHKNKFNVISVFQKFLGGLSLTTAAFFIYQRYSCLYLPAVLSPALFIGFDCINKMTYYKKQRQSIEVLVENMRKISRLNQTLFEYFKLRSVSPAMVLIINPYTRAMQELIQVIFKEEVYFLHGLKIFIRHIRTYVPSLDREYYYIEELDLEQFTFSNVTSIEDCIRYMKNLCDTYNLLASNSLACVCIAFCPIIWSDFVFDVNEIIDTVVPNVQKMSFNCFENINAKFNNVKYYYLNGIKPKPHFKPVPQDSSRKLYDATSNMLVKISHIVEKSHLIIGKLQDYDLQSLVEKEDVGKCISELRGDVFTYYQSLDILYKIYELDVNQSRPPLIFTKDSSSSESSVSSSPSIVTIDACQNNNDPQDEEYECYVKSSDSMSDAISVNSYEEESARMYSAILYKELKEKLKNHVKFIEARKKRGILDDDDSENQPSCSKTSDENPPKEFNVEEEPDDSPKFDIFLPKPLSPAGIPNPLPNCEPFNQVQVPPPPPPPLAPFDFGPYGEIAGTPYTVDDFFRSVKIAVTNRGGNIEEYFEAGSTTDED